MMYFSRKNVFVFLALLILVCVLAFTYSQKLEFNKTNFYVEPAVAQQSKKIIIEHNGQERASVGGDVEVISSKHLTAYDASSIKVWELAHGYFELSDLLEYKSYSLENLKTLALGGDLKALQLISEHHIENGDLDAAFKDFKHAAIYGSTQALSAYAIFSGIYLSSATTPEAKERYAIDALAFTAVAARRGDAYAELRASADFKKEHSFNPSPDQLKAIAKRADEIYLDLEAIRISLGLPAFDNSINAAAQRLYRLN